MVTWKLVSKYRGGDALIVAGHRYPLSDEQFKQLHSLVKATNTDRDVLLMYQQVTAPQSQPLLPTAATKGTDFDQYLAEHPDASFVEAALNSGRVAEAVQAELGQQSEWVQLEWASNWGGGFLCCREVCDPNSGQYSTTDSSKAVIWHEHDALQVYWPDGYLSTHVVHVEKVHGSDDDHGKNYGWTKDVPIIFYQVHGVRLTMRLTTPGLKVRRTWVEGRLHAGQTPPAKYTLRGDGGTHHTNDLSEFFANNSECIGANERAAIMLLQPGERYESGGGASPVWSITRNHDRKGS